MTRGKRGKAPYVVDAAGLRSLHFGPARIQSRMRLRAPDALVFDYTRLMAAFLLLAPRPRRVLLIGLGGGSLLKFLHRQVAGLRLDVVENDARVIALRDAFRIPADGRLRIHLGDGLDFLQAAQHRYDAILLDGFDEDGMPARLRSPRFVAACRRVLTPGGLLVLNMDSDDAALLRLRQHLHRVFDGAVLDLPDEDGGNRVIFAGRRLRRRVGMVRRPAMLQSAGWAELLQAVLRLQAAQQQALAAAPGLRRNAVARR